MRLGWLASCGTTYLQQMRRKICCETKRRDTTGPNAEPCRAALEHLRFQQVKKDRLTQPEYAKAISNFMTKVGNGMVQASLPRLRGYVDSRTTFGLDNESKHDLEPDGPCNS